MKHRKTLHDLCCIIKSKSHERARVCVCLRFRFKYVIFLSFTTIYFSHFDILLPHRRLCFILYYFIHMQLFFPLNFCSVQRMNLWLVELCKFNRFRFNISERVRRPPFANSSDFFPGWNGYMPFLLSEFRGEMKGEGRERPETTPASTTHTCTALLLMRYSGRNTFVSFFHPSPVSQCHTHPFQWKILFNFNANLH